MNKKVSIIVASYNRKNILRRNLEGIDIQKFKGFLEIIVVDDGSTDGTIGMLEEKAAAADKFALKYFKTLHLGPGNARNFGIAHAQGDILIFLDDDSVIQNSDYVQKMVESFEEKGVGIVAGRTLDFYLGLLKLVRAGDPPEVDFNNPSKLKKAVGVPTKNAAFLKEAILKAGGFDPVFKYAVCEDVDLCMRIFDLGYKLAFNKEALVCHYPTYSFKNYVRKSYLMGFSYGIFHSVHPDKSPRFSLLKAAVSPLLTLRKFVKKTKICFAEKLFTRAILKEITSMFIWISASYCALYLGEINYYLNQAFVSIKIRFKAFKDLNIYFLELIKYYIKAIFPPYRITFILYLTNRCNQRCQHCFYSQDINKNVQELSLGDLEKIAKNYYKYTKTNKFLAMNISQGFTGGEPFLRNDLMDIIFLFKAEGVRHFQINTNGMLTEKIINLSRNLLKENITFKIIVSIDGLEKTHNKIRNSPEAFQKAIKTIKELKNIGADVGTIMTINKLNYKETGEVVRFLNVNFGIEPGLQLIRGVSQSNAPLEVRDASDPLEKNILITQDIIPEIRNILYKIYLEKTIKNPFRMVEFTRKFTYIQCHLDILEKRKRLFGCVAGKSVGVIYQNGEVALCELYTPIGNLKEANFDLPSLWRNPLARKQRAFIKKCFCNHDCFINIEYNLKFAKYLMSNLNKFVTAALKFYNW